MIEKILRYSLLWFASLLLISPVYAQKVGLVLSGGGAKGLAHVGVLRQLEKNHIPIDYIVGTSMGAVVGGMYAAGYSPDEIEQLVLAPEFQNWTSGKTLESKTFNFTTSVPSPSALRLGVAIDSTLKARVSSNLVNDLNLNLALAKLMAGAGAEAGYDFNKLFVPFRCMTSEVFTRQEVVQRQGSLSDAVRNSMTFPLAFRPIRNLDGKYYYDGAVFDNFPTAAMKTEFTPDIIIGVNVGDVAYKKYPFGKDDDLLASTVLFLGTSVADTASVGKNGIYIQPNLVGLGVGDFDRVKDFIAQGDSAAMRKMALIKQRIGRRQDAAALQARRRAFQDGAPTPRFLEVQVQGLRPDQNEYAAKFFRRKGREYSFDDIEEGYYRLASDDYFKNIYPRIRYDAARQGYVFSVDAQRNNNLTTEVGFVLSTRPVDNLYLGVEFRYLRTLLYTASADVSVGRFYNGAHGSFRINVPGQLPFYFEPGITYNQWDFQNTSGGLLAHNSLNTQIRQQDTKFGFQVGASPNYRSRLVLDAGLFRTRDNYTNSAEINNFSTLDATVFRGVTAALRFSRNTLNEKQYATRGHHYSYSLRGVTGSSTYTPGSTSMLPASDRHHDWLQFRATVERYFDLTGDRRVWGYFGELMVSGQGTFSNFRASEAIAPVFAPLVDSRTLFLDKYRSGRYAAVGLRYSRPVLGKLQWRSEVYAHVNFQPFEMQADQQAVRTSGIERPRLTASTGFIFQTPVGPLALHARYYDDPNEHFGVYAHLGYLLFRGRALE